MKQIKIAEVSDIICDSCHNSCSRNSDPSINDPAFEYATIRTAWGYFSSRDDVGKIGEWHICEECCSKIETVLGIYLRADID